MLTDLTPAADEHVAEVIEVLGAPCFGVQALSADGKVSFSFTGLRQFDVGDL
jgi:hypothetical protein